MSRRDDLKLARVFEETLDAPIKAQLRAIGARVYDLVSPAVAEARAAAEPAERLRTLAGAHEATISVFESECEGYFHNVPGGLDVKRSLACRAGCSFCCYLKVELTAFEAVAIWATLAGDAFAAQRAAAVKAAPQVGLLDTEARRVQRIPCPLLVNGECSVYAARPHACRGFFSLSAQECEAVLQAPAGATLPPIRSPAVPRALASAFAAGINAALADNRMQHDLLELSAALARLEARPTALADWLAGQRVFDPTVPG